jgi:hypothetical protein
MQWNIAMRHIWTIHSYPGYFIWKCQVYNGNTDSPTTHECIRAYSMKDEIIRDATRYGLDPANPNHEIVHIEHPR